MTEYYSHCPVCGEQMTTDHHCKKARVLKWDEEEGDYGWYSLDELCQEQLVEAKRLIKGLLKMADEAMAAWGFAATHGIGLVDEKTAQEKDKLRKDARDFLGVTLENLEKETK